MKKFKINGYYGFYMPKHHLANKSGIVYEHILVAEEKVLNRPISKEEVVHHVDKNRSNNNPENLMVFATKADHTAYHDGCEAIKKGDVYICPEKGQKYICPICGNKKDYKAKICLYCLKQSKTLRPSKEKLLNSIKITKNKSEIGRMFGVSHTTINRWIKYYNIDFVHVS